jgi:L-ascorbate metabolism protein UlaG (beta-lactamase superfamily)
MSEISKLDLNKPPVSEAEKAAGSIFFVGTATVIIRYAGFAILTDPNFLHAGDHAHLGYGLTSERLTEPAMDIDQLPHIDFCILSHYHGDHFDQIVEEKLRKDLPIITTEHAAAELRSKGFTAPIALDTWDSVTVEDGNTRVRITSMPGQHGPGIVDFALPPVMGSMLDFETDAGQQLLRMYISGDTLIHDDLNEIPKRFPGVDLALLHLGGTRVLGVLVTMDDEQGVEMIRIVQPEMAIPIHYNDYDVFKSPLDDFKEAVAKAGLTERVTYLSHGDSYEFKSRSARTADIGRGMSPA